jgi:putative copper export protein
MIPLWEWGNLWNQLSGEERVFIVFMSISNSIGLVFYGLFLKYRRKNRELTKKLAELSTTLTSSVSLQKDK